MSEEISSESQIPKRKYFHHTQDWKLVLYAVSALLVLIVVFAAGMLAGFEKAEFTYRWGEKYYENVMGPRQPSPTNRFLDAHGTAGQIIKTDGDTVVVKDKDGSEKTVEVDNHTTINSGPKNLSSQDLKIGDNIIVIGGPNEEGQIDADLIRVVSGNLLQ